jgi:hypothetical protein
VLGDALARGSLPRESPPRESRRVSHCRRESLPRVAPLQAAPSEGKLCEGALREGIPLGGGSALYDSAPRASLPPPSGCPGARGRGSTSVVAVTETSLRAVDTTDEPQIANGRAKGIGRGLCQMQSHLSRLPDERGDRLSTKRRSCGEALQHLARSRFASGSACRGGGTTPSRANVARCDGCPIRAIRAIE